MTKFFANFNPPALIAAMIVMLVLILAGASWPYVLIVPLILFGAYLAKRFVDIIDDTPGSGGNRVEIKSDSVGGDPSPKAGFMMVFLSDLTGRWTDFVQTLQIIGERRSEYARAT